MLRLDFNYPLLITSPLLYMAANGLICPSIGCLVLRFFPLMAHYRRWPSSPPRTGPAALKGDMIIMATRPISLPCRGLTERNMRGATCPPLWPWWPATLERTDEKLFGGLVMTRTDISDSTVSTHTCMHTGKSWEDKAAVRLQLWKRIDSCCSIGNERRKTIAQSWWI